MSQTIEIKSVQISKNPCTVKEQIKIQIEAVFTGVDKPDEPQSLPFILPISGLGEGEW